MFKLKSFCMFIAGIVAGLYLKLRSFDWKGFLGFCMFIAGIVAGVYLGVWVCFIGGIVAFIEAFQGPEVQALDAALAFARIWFSGLVGWSACFALVIPGLKLLK